ncbi:MAG: LysR family glycine cleavage system transcriptional activator [Halieaceae bacterium]|jgi:LysR family glycine cleavage system transcriptional activator
MSSRYGRIPSTRALICFESAARLRSFSRAAEELYMTQSAVSHQIRSLEDQMHQPLFRRLGRTVELTDAGVDLLETTDRTLTTLSSGIRRLDFYTKPGSVVFSCSHAWARHWLLHRLPLLKAEHPELEPWIHTTDAAFDFEHSEADCAVWYGDGSWPNLTVEHLFDEKISPVCTPEYAAKIGGLTKPQQLQQAELLHDERWDGWSAWFSAAALDASAPVAGMNFSDPGIMLDSALAGNGVALASLTLASEALEKGHLVQPFDLTLDTGMAWYLVAEPRRINRPAEQAFWQWMLTQTGKAPS